MTVIAWGVSWTVDGITDRPVSWSRGRLAPNTSTWETSAAAAAVTMAVSAPAAAAWAGGPPTLVTPAISARLLISRIERARR